MRAFALAASALLITLVTPSAVAQEQSDLDILRERRKPFIHESVLNVNQAPTWIQTQKVDGTWDDVDYTSGCPAQRSNWPAGRHWQRIVALASIYSGGQAAEQLRPLVGDAGLLSDIFTAVDWWFQQDFDTTACLTKANTTACPCGTPGLWNTNWFSNVILIPRLVGQTCILLEEKMSEAQLATCVKMTSRSFSTFGTGESFLAGANILDIASIGIAGGILSGNTTMVDAAFGYINNEVVVHPEVKVDGIKPDGSFSQHIGMVYNGNYGKDYTNVVLQVAVESAGTVYEPSAASKKAFVTFINGTRWMIYQNTKQKVLHYDFSVVGRFIAFHTADLDRTVAVSSILINTTKFDDLGKLWGDETLQDIAEQLRTPTKSANIGGLLGNRMFWSNDFMVHRSKKYWTSLKMFSSRTTNSECVNSANGLGFHLSDGVTYNHLDGSEYEDISAAWDWNLIPGITTDYARTPLACASVQMSNPNAFVGGVSDNIRGLAAMQYTNPITGALSWKKAWFFLDDDVQHVMVNSISATDPTAEVYSVLDQRRIAGSILVNGHTVLPDGGNDARVVQNFTNPGTLLHGGVGYVFGGLPSGSYLAISAGDRTGSWQTISTSTQPPTTAPLVAAWIRHSPSNLSRPIEYTAFPGVSSQEDLRRARTAAAVVTLANTPELMGVWDKRKQVAYGVFWSATSTLRILDVASVGTLHISSSHPLILIANFSGHTPRDWTVTVADPSQTLASATLRFTWVTVRPRGWGSVGSRTVEISFPAGGNAGSSITTRIAP